MHVRQAHSELELESQTNRECVFHDGSTLAERWRFLHWGCERRGLKFPGDVDGFFNDTDFRSEIKPGFMCVSGSVEDGLSASVVSALSGFEEAVTTGRDFGGGKF